MAIHLSQLANILYPFLDIRSQGRLARTNHHFYEAVKTNRQIQAVVNLILENYNVVASSVPESRLREVLLLPSPIVIMGETHIKDQDRYLNSHLINLLWNERSTLFIEGSSTSVERWKRSADNPEMLKYMRGEIKDSAVTWDDDATVQRTSQSRNKFAEEFVDVTQVFIEFFQKSKFSYNLLMQYLNDEFPEGFKDLIVKESPSIELLEAKGRKVTAKEKHDLKKQIQNEIRRVILEVYSKVNQRQIETTFTEGKIREASLNKFASNIFKSEKHLAFFLAGRDHVNSQIVVDNLKNLKKSNPNHFLAINPKQDNTHLTISGSFQRLGVTLPAVDPNYKTHNKFFSIAFKDEPLTKEEKEILLIKFLAFNPDDIGTQENHFGLWTQVCFKLLEGE